MSNVSVEAGTPCRLKNISGDAMEVMVTIKQGEARRYGVRVLCDNDNSRGLDVVVEPGARSLHVGGVRAPLELGRIKGVRNLFRRPLKHGFKAS